MKFIILNRFDPLNPKAGGAELFTGQVAIRLISLGHEVTWFSSSASNLKVLPEYDGIKFIRKGNIISVVFWAWKYLRGKYHNFDYVLDEIHAYPFFTPLFIPAPKRLVLIHEVAGKIWFYMSTFPFNIIGFLIEKFALRFIYKNEVFFTVSESTKKELVANGIKQEKISILSEGVTVSQVVAAKTNNPQLIYMGGLRKLKRVEHQLAAMAILRKEYPTIKLVILGRKEGKYYQGLVKLVKKLGLDEIVEFKGYVSNEERDSLIASSWMTLGTSVKDGWGLAVAEAGAFGLPAVVYKTPGNIDAVIHLETGLYTIENNPEKLALGIKKLIEDEDLRQELGKGAKLFAKTLSWDKTVKQFLERIRDLQKSIADKTLPEST